MTTDKRPEEVSARLSALRGGQAPNDLPDSHIGAGFAQDSHTRNQDRIKRGGYITSARAREVAHSLNDRDRQVVDLLATVQLASGAQIRHLLWGEGVSAARQCRRQLARMSEQRVVARQERRVGGVRSGAEGYAYGLDVVGQLLTGVTAHARRPRPLGLPFIDHAMAVTDCYLAIRALEDRGEVELVHFETEPRCWRDSHGPGGARRVLKPDAFLISVQGDFEDRWFLEVDRCTESPSRLLAKAEAYIAYFQSGREQAETGAFPRALWVVPDEARQNQLVKTLGKLPEETVGLFRVTTTGEFAPTILSGAGDDEGKDQ